jgi:hypothetical protein
MTTPDTMIEVQTTSTTMNRLFIALRALLVTTGLAWPVLKKINLSG